MVINNHVCVHNEILSLGSVSQGDSGPRTSKVGALGPSSQENIYRYSVPLRACLS